MAEYQLISDYKHISKYRESFIELANHLFKINFTEWYNKGCWNDNYICYSFVDGDQVIANASVNKMVITSNGTDYKAIQVGAVMTHPDYRHQGLAVKLMKHIIETYENEVDFIYLFANDTVLDFYPKFGFEKVQESHFYVRTSDLKPQSCQKSMLRKLDVNNEVDFEVMHTFAAARIPVSSQLGVKDSEQILMFYFMLALPHAIYYVEAEDVIVLFTEEENQLHVFDIVSKTPVDVERIIHHVISDATETVHFHFVPDCDNKHIQFTLMTEPEDTLFVRPAWKEGVKPFLLPFTSHA
ncbi:GNAT family N-acetyltransferase [Paenibacillus sp. 481]|uniref:GNAT family N-acetyltransferase n=1 Tax=Paenibacillus sp. 481 TaxID=2835869 RepID=UPI001E288A91|nr:GNAT family N-acetyltransferase [Paenibacillus sp. 481]UHA73482.1 GNAT family N-acetyltransferase [Paenibacillus sp. 481]